jgi:aspartate kinase
MFTKSNTLRKPVVVQKFGGSSLDTPEKIREVAKRVKDLHNRGVHVIVVVSAMGKTTDDLVELSRQVTRVPNRRELDMLLSTGERISMSLMAMALTDFGVPAISFTGSQAGVLTSLSHSNAQVLDVRPTRVEDELQKGHVVVLAGFQGVNPEAREITTLGRGGSDTTAVAMAAHFQAQMCEVLKDVDGVYTADPRVVPHARHLPELSYDQLLEMTFWGAKVLHYRSVELAQRRNVPLRISLTHGSTTRRTDIKKETTMYEQGKVLALNSIANVWKLTIMSAQQARAMGILGEFLKTHHLPWPQILICDSTHDCTDVFFTCANETSDALKQIVQRESSMQMSATAYSTVTLNCVGWVSNDLPAEAMALLNSKQISTYKTLASSTSLTFFIERLQKDSALQVLHDRLVK